MFISLHHMTENIILEYLNVRRKYKQWMCPKEKDEFVSQETTNKGNLVTDKV